MSPSLSSADLTHFFRSPSPWHQGHYDVVAVVAAPFPFASPAASDAPSNAAPSPDGDFFCFNVSGNANSSGSSCKNNRVSTHPS